MLGVHCSCTCFIEHTKYASVKIILKLVIQDAIGMCQAMCFTENKDGGRE